uniref:THAP-type domain-containing protein n=1 Tax=Bombyx mori TaxID=7091 RepID=A0A8R2HS91_BOMMO|nr:uncharacterized protein LOC110385721 isoform X1 [Bombyx mori]
MPACVVKWCRSHSRLNCPGITFHYFPADAIRQKKWIAAVKLERQEYDWMPVKTSRVCSIHFDKKDFYKSLKGYTMLHKTAVPVCTMIRFEETPTSSRNSTENENNNNERLQSVDENSLFANFKVGDLPEQFTKTNTAEPQAHKAQKLKLENKIVTEYNEGAAEESRKKNFENNLVSNEVHTFEERVLCVTPINIPSSDIESELNTPRTHMLKHELRKKSFFFFL